VLVAVSAALISLTRATRDKTLRIAGLAVLLLLALDGITHSPKFAPTLPTVVLEPGLVKLDPPPGLDGNRALLIRPAHDEVHSTMISDPLKDFILHRQALFGNCNLLDRVPTPDGFYSLYLREQREVWAQMWLKQTNYIVSPLLDFLSVRHINSDNIFDWTNRVSTLPIVTIGQAPVFADAPTTLETLLSPAFDPKRTVLLPPEAQALVRATAPVEASVVSSWLTAHRIELKVQAAADTLLVLAQSRYAPWRAFADQQPVPLLRANHGFQAVPVSAGTHNIVLEYHDTEFRMGLIVTIGVLLLVAALWSLCPRWL